MGAASDRRSQSLTDLETALASRKTSEDEGANFRTGVAVSRITAKSNLRLQSRPPPC